MKHEKSAMIRYMRLITAGGCLAMVYIACISSAVTTDYFKSLGATEMHFGLLGGVPMIMLSFQFLGAYIIGGLTRRKPWFLTMLITCRCLYLAVAFLPLLIPGVSSVRWIPVLIGLIALSSAMSNFIIPLWFSWIGDLIPRRILNRYWGTKHGYMTFVSAIMFGGIAAFTYYLPDMPAMHAYAILVSVGVLAGVIDIVLFVWVHEPENQPVGKQGTLDIFLQPLRHKEYRTFIVFRIAIFASLMMGAAYMWIYLLKIIGMPRWQLCVLGSSMALGNAVVARSWGRIADKFGHRPVILLCVLFKSVVCITFLLVTPRTAFPVLLVVLFFDSMLNCGRQIASNGYMLNMAPKKNRSMFVAAITALSGIAGGLAAILAGVFLTHTQSFSLTWLGRDWTHYHLLFLISAICRLLCIPLAAQIQEPRSKPPRAVLGYLRGLWPMRVFLFPVGLYRSHSNMSSPSR